VIPERLLVRILPGRLRYCVGDTPVATAPNAEIRLLIAPMNFAGQGRRWAQAVTDNVPSAAAANLAVRLNDGFGFEADTTVDGAPYAFSTDWNRRQFAACQDFSHVIIEAERHPYGRIYAQSVAGQARRLADAGVQVAMLCHGSDIRLPSRHLASEPDSPFAPGLWELTPTLEHQARQNRALLDELGLPTFVSTPGLLDDVPDARWVPVVVDPARWAVATPPLERAVPIVAHAPTNPIVKGSDLIDPVLKRMHEDGEIEYVRVQGVPSAEMPRVYGNADIVLDWFRMGEYGVAACEALAAGRVVVSHVNERVRERVHAATGFHLPIVQARAAEVADVIRDILANRDRYRQQAALGPAFVAAVHDGRRSAEALTPFLLSSKGPVR